MRSFFHKNLNQTGRILRAAVGIILLAVSVIEKSWPAFFGALFCFFESYMSWCVVFQIFGINSCKIKK